MTQTSPERALAARIESTRRECENVATHLADLERALTAAENNLASAADHRGACRAFDHSKSKRDQTEAILRARRRELAELEARLSDPDFLARAKRFDACTAAMAAGPDQNIAPIMARVEELGAEFARARADLLRVHADRMLAYAEACELAPELGAAHPIQPTCDSRLVLRSALARGLRRGGANPLDRDVSDSLAVHHAEPPSVPFG